MWVSSGVCDVSTNLHATGYGELEKVCFHSLWILGSFVDYSSCRWARGGGCLIILLWQGKSSCLLTEDGKEQKPRKENFNRNNLSFFA